MNLVAADDLDRLLLRALFHSADARAWVRAVGIGPGILDDAALRPVVAWLLDGAGDDFGAMPEALAAVLERGGAASLADWLLSTELRPAWALSDVHRVARMRAARWLPGFWRDAANHLDRHAADGRGGPIIEHAARVSLALAAARGGDHADE